jgi:hypothetical protein
MDMWFELHRYEPGQPWFSPEYCQWMAKGKFPVMMAEQRPEIPNSHALPVDELLEKYTMPGFNPRFWMTSSLAWMFLAAIDAGATKIGLWGVDMSATEEYGDQRSGCHRLAELADSRGIEVGIPSESDLFCHRPLYGVDEITHGSIKALARLREFQRRHAAAVQLAQQHTMEAQALAGAMDQLKYSTDTWTDRSRQYTAVRNYAPAPQPRVLVPVPPADPAELIAGDPTGGLTAYERDLLADNKKQAALEEAAAGARAAMVGSHAAR